MNFKLALRAKHLAEPITATLVEAFSIPGHALVAGGQHLPCVLLPGVERPPFFGERQIVKDLSLRVMRGDRIGLIGRNGVGKSTLIRILLGLEPPDSGSVRMGTNLKIAYFDQMRAVLDPEKTVLETIANGSDWVETGTQRKHVMSYLGDFLFAPQRAHAWGGPSGDFPKSADQA